MAKPKGPLLVMDMIYAIAFVSEYRAQLTKSGSLDSKAANAALYADDTVMRWAQTTLPKKGKRK